MGLLGKRDLRLGKTSAAVLTLIAISASTAACTKMATPDATSDSNYSASELQARADYLAGLAKSLGIDNPPWVDLVRIVSAQEWPDTQIACMNDAGYPVRLLPDGEGIDATDIPESQRYHGGPFQLAMYECEAKYTLDPSTTQPLSDAQLGLLYEWYVNESAPCLKAQGVSVTPPPSKQSFIETYFTNDGWYPYGTVDAMAMPDDQWTDLNAACPQAPEDQVLGQ